MGDLLERKIIYSDIAPNKIIIEKSFGRDMCVVAVKKTNTHRSHHTPSPPWVRLEHHSPAGENNGAQQQYASSCVGGGED